MSATISASCCARSSASIRVRGTMLGDAIGIARFARGRRRPGVDLRLSCLAIGPSFVTKGIKKRRPRFRIVMSNRGAKTERMDGDSQGFDFAGGVRCRFAAPSRASAPSLVHAPAMVHPAPPIHRAWISVRLSARPARSAAVPMPDHGKTRRMLRNPGDHSAGPRPAGSTRTASSARRDRVRSAGA